MVKQEYRHTRAGAVRIERRTRLVAEWQFIFICLMLLLAAIVGGMRASQLEDARADVKRTRRQLAGMTESYRMSRSEVDGLNQVLRDASHTIDALRSEVDSVTCALEAVEEDLDEATREHAAHHTAKPTAPQIAPTAAGRRTGSFTVTAYCPGPCPTCGTNGTTATGTKAGRGQAAVDPRVIPLGSTLSIPGYGTARATDTGGGIKGNRIDVCFPSHAEALQWGRRTVAVTW